jgi:hypothetical protein
MHKILSRILGCHLAWQHNFCTGRTFQAECKSSESDTCCVLHTLFAAARTPPSNNTCCMQQSTDTCTHPKLSRLVCGPTACCQSTRFKLFSTCGYPPQRVYIHGFQARHMSLNSKASLQAPIVQVCTTYTDPTPRAKLKCTLTYRSILKQRADAAPSAFPIFDLCTPTVAVAHATQHSTGH